MDSTPNVVDIVIPVFNEFDLFTQTLQSIRNQSFSHYRIIIVDDCSTDGTTERLKALQSRDIEVLFRSNSGGPGVARNDGIALATSKYVAFCDSDDLWEPEKLLLQVEYLESHPECVLLGTRASTFVENEDGIHAEGHWLFETEDDAVREYLAYNSSFATPAVLIRRSVLEDHQIMFRTDIGRAAGEDYDFWVKLAEHGKVGNLPGLLTRCRQHQRQTTRRSDYDMFDFPSEVRGSALKALGIVLNEVDLATWAKVGRYELLEGRELLDAVRVIKEVLERRKRLGISTEGTRVHEEMAFQLAYRQIGLVRRLRTFACVARGTNLSPGKIVSCLKRIIKK